MEEGRAFIDEDFLERPQLPEDCVYKILTRIAASSLRPCLRVCRSWRRLAYQPTFEAEHSLHTATMPGFLLVTLRFNEYYYSFLPIHGDQRPIPIASLLPDSDRPQSLFIEAASPAAGGLVLFSEHMATLPGDNHCTTNYYITHLSPPHHRRIPSPSIRSFEKSAYAVCSGAGKDYKIARICEPRWTGRAKTIKSKCEIFDSTAGKWRFSGFLPYFMIMERRGVAVNQTAYWIVCENISKYHDQFKICAFDMEEERGRLLQGPAVPSDVARLPWKWKLVACEDRLCLVHFFDGEAKVWMLAAEGGGEFQGWEWKGSVSTQRLKDHTFAFEDGIHDEDVVLLETLYRELWYDFKGKDYVYFSDRPRNVWKLHLDAANLRNLVKK